MHIGFIWLDVVLDLWGGHGYVDVHIVVKVKLVIPPRQHRLSKVCWHIPLVAYLCCDTTARTGIESSVPPRDFN